MPKKINKRPVDFLTDDIGPWWRKSYDYARQKEVSTWKGSLVLMFVAGFFVALIWSVKTDYHTSSLAAPSSSAVYFTPASTTVPAGSDFSLNAMINPGTDAIGGVMLRITFDATRLRLDSITPSSTFSDEFPGKVIDNTGGTASIDLGVPTANPNVTTTSSMAVFNFHSLTVGSNSPVNFASTSMAIDAIEMDNAIVTRTGSSVTVVPADQTAPSGGSITYTNGYAAAASVALTVADGTDASGINTSSRIVQRRSATLSNNTCGTYGSWGTITPTGAYPNFTDATVLTGNCYQYQYLVSDTVVPANQATYTSANVAKIDTVTPAGGSINYTNGYFTTASVSVTVSDGTDAASGINTASRILQRRSATMTSGTCGTYGSWGTITQTGTYPNFTDATVATGNCYQYQYLVSDNAGRQATYTGTNTAKVDTAVPAGGSITYTDGYYITASVAITASDGTDAASGINTASRVVNRRSATLSAGTCGTYGSWAAITPTGTYPNFIDATVANGNCYQYQYQVSDNAGGQATLTGSSTAKIDTVNPAGGSLTYADGYNSNHLISLTASDGTDAVSGINQSSRTIQRRSATLSGGTCGTYSSWGALTPAGSYPNLTDSTVLTGGCYQYQFLISDNAGRQVTYASTSTVKISYVSDINLSGTVDMFDYVQLRSDYGSTNCSSLANISGNKSGSCVVDMFDYVQLRSEYGMSV